MKIGTRMRDVTWKPNAVVQLAKHGITREYLDQSQTFQSALRMGLKLMPDDFVPDSKAKLESPSTAPRREPPAREMGTVKAKDDPDTVAVEDLDDASTGADQEPEAEVLAKRRGDDPEKLRQPSTPDEVVATSADDPGEAVPAGDGTSPNEIIDRIAEEPG